MRINKKSKPGKAFAVLIVSALVFIVTYFNSDILNYLGGGNNQTGKIGRDGTLQVHFIDVGQGDSSLIVTPDGEAVLIDAGPNSSEEKLSSYLELQGITDIKYLVLTHPHEDHIGGADMIINNYNTENIIMPDITSDTMTFQKLLEAVDSCNCSVFTAVPETEYTLDDVTLVILAPVEIKYGDLNNCSIVLRLEYGDTSFLFTGDAEKESEALMLKRYPASYLSCDVLKCGHHGSFTASSEAFLNAVAPSLAVISCGKGNDYGHPHRETLLNFERFNISYYRTDLDGSVVMKSDGTVITVID